MNYLNNFITGEKSVNVLITDGTVIEEKASGQRKPEPSLEKKVPEIEKIALPALKNKFNKLWIILPVVFAVITLGVLAGLYYYALYLNKPNFEVNDFNKMLQSTSGPVVPDQEIQYSIEFKNTGNTDITGLFIETDIPENTDFVSSSNNSTISSDVKKIKFNVGSLVKDYSGKVFFVVKVKNPLDNGTEIKVSDAVFSYIARENQKEFKIIRDLVNTVKSNPDFSDFTLSFKDLNGDKISIGDDILFVIRIGNTGDMNAENFKITNLLPDKFILYENSLQPAAAFDKDTGEIVWDIEKINTGEVKNFSFKAKIGDNFDNLETFKDIASLTYENESIKEISVEDKVFGFPNFSTSASIVEHPAGGDVWAGDILKFTVTVINSGLRAGEDIEIVCPVPKYTTYVQNSAMPADSAEFDKEANVLKWKIKSINKNEPLSLTFETKIGSLTKGGTISSAFYIEGDDQSFEMEPLSIGVRSYIFQTIVCMGDSQIVKSNWPSYLDGALESAYPRAEYNTIGSGVKQERAYQGARRFDSTVAVYKPQIIVIGYGTNDVGAGGTSPLTSGIQDLINKAKNIGATVIVQSIGYIDTGKNPAKKGWEGYNRAIQSVCAANGVPYVDIASPMSDDPSLYLTSDGMHWSPAGGQLVAQLVFNTMRNYLDGEGKRK